MGRKRKSLDGGKEEEGEGAAGAGSSGAGEQAAADAKPERRRGRPRKKEVESKAVAESRAGRRKSMEIKKEVDVMAGDVKDIKKEVEVMAGDAKAKRGRGRPKKAVSETPKAKAPAGRRGKSRGESSPGDPQKSSRRRAKKSKNGEVQLAGAVKSEGQQGDETQKRGRGRPKKSKDEKQKPEAGKRRKTESHDQLPEEKKKSRRGRPKKSDQEKSERDAKEKRKGKAKMSELNPKSAFRTKKVSSPIIVAVAPVRGVEFRVGEDVYVRKTDITEEKSESDSELEECRICGTGDEKTMLECDNCLAGYHLTCLDPPLESVPEDDWTCPFCKNGENPPHPQTSKHKHRSARERLLSGDLWAARIERMWREVDGKYWFEGRWFLIPEDTAPGRQPHSGRRELFRSNKTDQNEMDSILRHCYVMSPEDYKKSNSEGDDIFFCEYEYNELFGKFKRIEYLDDNENWSEDGHDEPFGPSDESDEDDSEDEFEGQKRRRSVRDKRLKQSKSIRAANKRRNYSGGIEEVGAKSIPDGARKRPRTEFERARSALTLSAIPPSLPCRDRERKEITAFLKDSVGAGEHCLGRCLYISGVPGTGKTATVLEVVKELGRKVDLGEIPPYRFVEINGLRLPSPEHVYTMLHEALTGQHVGWKRALRYLDERFSNARPLKGLDTRPCVLLVDELDLLVTRNQSVLYNIFDWPSRPQSRLIIIGIANTMDLPERMLPRIASRMGMQRISFGPYSHKQLEEIISARLTGVKVFDQQAAEFASRKVAAVSGDIRRALELCRRAVEVAEARLELQSFPLDCPASDDPSARAAMASTHETQQGLQASRGSITMADVDAAISEMFDAPQIQMMRRSAKLAKIFLVAMVCEQRRTAMAETTFEKVAVACSELCSNNGEESPNWETLLGIGCKLGACRLLLCEPGTHHRLQKLQLNFPCDDVSFALNKDEKTPWLARYL